MIRAGASPKTVQTVLGHASAAFTLTVYGHIFDADLDDLAERLEILRRDTDGISVEPASRARGNRTLGPAETEAPGVGLEPTTYGLTVRRSAS